MEKIHNYLKLLYLQAGVTLEIKDDEEIFACYTSHNTLKIFNFLIKLRDKNYNLYLECLSALLLVSYYNLKYSAGFYKAAEENTYSLTDDEQEILEDAMDLSDPEITAIKALLNYIDLSHDLKDLDASLYKDNSLDLICLFIPDHIEAAFEVTFEYICYDLLITSETLIELARFISPQVMNEIAIIAINYAISNDPVGLVDLVTIAHDVTNSIDVGIETHKYFISLFLKYNCIDELALYIHDIIWSAYQHCKFQESNPEIDEDFEQFMIDFEDNQNIQEKLCFELLNTPDQAKLFDMFFDHEYENFVPEEQDPEEEQELEDFLNHFYEQKKKETKKIVRKLIPEK